MQRRQFIKAGVGLSASASAWAKDSSGAWVNDPHSELNRTHVLKVARPSSVKQLKRLLKQGPVSICGSRHSMGGQQFGTDTTLIDARSMKRVVSLDRDFGRVRVEAGITWPELQAELMKRQADEPQPWSIIQKQTGADELTIGGAVSSNIHGRGLDLQPFIADVESLALLGPDGVVRRCSRYENRPLFRGAFGGYGMLGLIVTVELRLQRRFRVKRVVEVLEVAELSASVTQRIADGCVYGDLQFCTAPEHPGFLKEGLFSCYRRVPDETPLSVSAKELGPKEWAQFYHLAHSNKPEAYTRYLEYYGSTDGQVYDSDTHQFGTYLSGYHNTFNQLQGYANKRSLMISELYVPRDRLAAFMDAARQSARRLNMDIIYGTIRFIRQDLESHLNWAREDYACIVLNLRVTHTDAGLALAREQFVQLIDDALAENGSFYLTYHRWARKDQLMRAYPLMDSWLALKQKVDPKNRITSDWYRHLAQIMGEA